MVTHQLSILDMATPPTEVEQPRCRMCARPARWLTTQEQYAMYCAGKACSNRERICQHCDNPFTVRANGAGNKYCSSTCKEAGYHPTPTPTASCAWCGKPRHRGDHRGGIWPYICQDCINPIRHLVNRLKKHRVPHERVRRLLDDPGCEVCGTDLIARTRDTSTGQLVSQLVVDHDHDCCASEYSCGRCVRGLLCARCNTAAGMVLNSPQTAQALAGYLDRWFSR